MLQRGWGRAALPDAEVERPFPCCHPPKLEAYTLRVGRCETSADDDMLIMDLTARHPPEDAHPRSLLVRLAAYYFSVECTLKQKR
jgi:hypothetical protein